MKSIQKHSGKIITLIILILFSYLAYRLYIAPVQGLDEKFIYLMKKDGYVILFAWSVVEGEMGLIMAGLLSHTDNMSLSLAIFVAGLGGFTGDQIYFYIGRYNRSYVHSKFAAHRRKLALAHLLLKKYGWPIIFVQRYMYGMRTVIPISIGLTGYNAKKYAFINLLSAWCWAAVIIVPVWYFGKEILSVFEWIKEHLYFEVPVIFIVVGMFIWIIYKKIKK